MPAAIDVHIRHVDVEPLEALGEHLPLCAYERFVDLSFEPLKPLLVV